MAEGNVGWQMQTLKFDLMREYRNTIPEEQQDQIWEQVGQLHCLHSRVLYYVFYLPLQSTVIIQKILLILG